MSLFSNFVSSANFPQRDDFFFLFSNDAKATYAFSKERFLKSLFFRRLLHRKKVRYEHFFPNLYFSAGNQNSYWLVGLDYSAETCTLRQITERISFFPSFSKAKPLRKKTSNDFNAPEIFFKVKREKICVRSFMKIFFKDRRILCSDGANWYHLNHSNFSNADGMVGAATFFSQANISFDFENFLLYDNAETVKHYFRDHHGVPFRDFKSIDYFYVRKCAKGLPIFSEREKQLMQDGVSVLLLSFLKKMKISYNGKEEIFDRLNQDFSRLFESGNDFDWFKNDFLPDFLVRSAGLDRSSLKILQTGLNYMRRFRETVQLKSISDKIVLDEFIQKIRQISLSMYEDDEKVVDINDYLRRMFPERTEKALTKEEFLQISNKRIIDSIICQKVYEFIERRFAKKQIFPFVVLQKSDSSGVPIRWFAISSSKTLMKKIEKFIVC